MEDSKRSQRRIVVVAMTAALLLTAALGFAGCGSDASGDESSPELEASLSRYRDYLRENAAELSRQIAKMTTAIEKEAGKEPVPGAEVTYAPARVSYGHIEPAALLHPTLARRIDGLEEDVPPDEFGGFHEIEKMIFWELVTSSLKPVAKRLAADVAKLRTQIDSDELQAGQLVTGAGEVVDGIVDHLVPGDTERWSHSDLIDAGAKIEGVDAAFAAVAPLLAEADPELTKQIEGQIEKATDAVGEFGTLARDSDPSEPERAGTGFIRYDQIWQDERWQLAAPFKKLSGLLSQAEEDLGS
jgi:iron uptake system component EfeO